MPKMLPIMTNGNCATSPEPFYHKRGEQRRSSAPRAKSLEWNGNLAQDRKVVGMGIRAFTPFGGLCVAHYTPRICDADQFLVSGTLPNKKFDSILVS